jgi:flavin-dependent dehydrogenase
VLDVLIAGAGPAGSVAALLLARSGARVLIVDRDAFPRDKLCGDTLNPGAVTLVRSLGLRDDRLAAAHRLHGMRLTGPRAEVIARYPEGQTGLAIARLDLDAWLLDEAVRAGARFESGVTVRRALVGETGGHRTARGAVLSRAGSDAEIRMPALMTLAADGRRSTLARALDLVEPRRSPGRWAYGVYATGVQGPTDLGEMHVRRGWYFGIAPIGGDRVNVCVVKVPRQPGQPPADVIREALDREPEIAGRFSGATFDDRVRVLGPLAFDVRAPGVPGLLLAGDASGFVDPMTGDGLRLAIQGSMLAAAEIARALETGDQAAAVARLASARRAAFRGKLRFNRIVRSLVDSPLAVDAASIGSHLAPFLVRSAVRYAGDVARGARSWKSEVSNQKSDGLKPEA